MRLGAHQSVAGGWDRALALAIEDGCEAVQIFTKNASMWREPALDGGKVEAFRAARQAWEDGLGHAGRVMAHASYLVNLAADDPAILARSRDALVHELERSDVLGVDEVVVHPGAHLGLGRDEGVARVGESLAIVLERTRGASTRLCLENTAGQGSVLGTTPAELGAMIVAAGPEGARLGVCIDTQHAFASGHDLGDPGGYDAFWAALARVVGLERLAFLHLNDSKADFGSRVDRHEHIGQGAMGLYAFHRLANDEHLRDVPAVLELAPIDGDRRVRANIALVRGLEGGARAEPEAELRAHAAGAAEGARAEAVVTRAW